MNVNNQTIHQFSGINSIVKQATGRENVSNIDMNHVTVAQNKQWMNLEASGDMVAFGTLAAAPMKVIAQIKAVQSGEGDPSPSNIRPIQGFDSVAITVSPTPGEGGRVYGTNLPNPPGTVYGGSLTINKDGSAELVVDKGYIEVDENTNILSVTKSTLTDKYCIARISLPGRYYSYSPEAAFITSGYKWIMSGSTSELYRRLGNGECGGQSTQLPASFRDDRISDDTLYPTVDDKKAAFKTLNDGLQIVYPLATPVSYQFTAEQISSIIGENYVWSNTGEISVDVAVLQDSI